MLTVPQEQADENASFCEPYPASRGLSLTVCDGTIDPLLSTGLRSQQQGAIGPDEDGLTN